MFAGSGGGLSAHDLEQRARIYQGLQHINFKNVSQRKNTLLMYVIREQKAKRCKLAFGCFRFLHLILSRAGGDLRANG